MTSFVYFAEQDNAIKIGCSTNPILRIKEIQSSNPSPVRLAGFLRGERTKERDLHNKFMHLRIRGEWFHKAPELMQFIQERTDKRFGLWQGENVMFMARAFQNEFCK